MVRGCRGWCGLCAVWCGVVRCGAECGEGCCGGEGCATVVEDTGVVMFVSVLNCSDVLIWNVVSDIIDILLVSNGSDLLFLLFFLYY